MMGGFEYQLMSTGNASVQDIAAFAEAVGSSGMAETLGDSSSIYNISVYFENSQKADTEITIKNSAGKTIMKHTATKSFNHLAAGTAEFELGETYTIYLNGTEYQSFTISNITTTIGNSNINQQNMMSAPGGRPDNFR